jgi:hypothetical protein
MTADSLIDLHRSFWKRSLKKPLINSDCSNWLRSSAIAALPPQWLDLDGLALDPASLWPQEIQPPPYDLGTPDNTHGEVAFNTLMPLWRVPWVAGIVGCPLKVSAASRVVWPDSYMDEDWHRDPEGRFSPRLQWLDKLLEFVRYIVDNYFPQRCLPTMDEIARGPGDLLLHVLTPERMFYGFYDHPQELKILLDRITDYYIRWAEDQLACIPPYRGGFCNQYGIWSPGSFVRTQEDYAMTLSEGHYKEFLLPADLRVAAAFDYPVFHTHSGFPQLADWVLEIEDITCIEVAIDPHGPSIEELLPQWNRILDRKCLIVMGPVTQGQLETLIRELSPGGLCLDVDVVSEEDLATAWEWDKSEKPNP